MKNVSPINVLGIIYAPLRFPIALGKFYLSTEVIEVGTCTNTSNIAIFTKIKARIVIAVRKMCVFWYCEADWHCEIVSAISFYVVSIISNVEPL